MHDRAMENRSSFIYAHRLTMSTLRLELLAESMLPLTNELLLDLRLCRLVSPGS